MGILSASCSFTRFKITEPVPKELWMEIPAKLRQFAFQDIDDIAEERGWGWTSFEDMLDMQWRSAPPEKGAYLAFALRLDTRRIPPAVLKKYVTIALVKKKAASRNKEKSSSPGIGKTNFGIRSNCASWGVFSPFRPYLTWRGQPIPTSSTWHPHKQNSLNFS
jgi:hypothetical protein